MEIFKSVGNEFKSMMYMTDGNVQMWLKSIEIDYSWKMQAFNWIQDGRRKERGKVAPTHLARVNVNPYTDKTLDKSKLVSAMINAACKDGRKEAIKARDQQVWPCSLVALARRTSRRRRRRRRLNGAPSRTRCSMLRAAGRAGNDAPFE